MDLYQTLAGEKENPCLIPIIQIFEQNATVYVVSEYLGLQTLEEHLQQQGGKESWCRAKRYLMPLYNALSHLHKRGITHQGLSPQNIFLDQNLNPYLSGFSLSEIRTAQGELDSELFSGYSAPGTVSSGKLAGKLDRRLFHCCGHLPCSDRKGSSGRGQHAGCIRNEKARTFDSCNRAGCRHSGKCF